MSPGPFMAGETGFEPVELPGSPRPCGLPPGWAAWAACAPRGGTASAPARRTARVSPSSGPSWHLFTSPPPSTGLLSVLYFEAGTLSKTVGEIDLRNVGDTQVAQSLLDRLLGIGSVALISTDKTSPVSVLRWMAAPRSLRELVRTRAYPVSHRHVFTRAT
ncbi:PH domain-containing protein [Myxococcus xanthus]|uniref:PH domain-containing protein n=1 Tax=Myxococcus xanthus TaxID=34 RepID=UPI001129A6DB